MNPWNTKTNNQENFDQEDRFPQKLGKNKKNIVECLGVGGGRS